MPISKEASLTNFPQELLPSRITGHGSVRTTIKCLVLDYDGTISPLNVERARSRVPKKTREPLQKIAKLIPVAILTTKDLSFVTTRTPFARAWSAISGLETKIGSRIQQRKGLLHGIKRISLALEYARSRLIEEGTEIEEKQDTLHRTVAFCVDWRRANNPATAKKKADNVAAYGRKLGLKVITYENLPFFDVYPTDVDKGRALADLLKGMGVADGVLYMGDSEADNPAFEKSSISVGVLHDENSLRKLTCDFYVKFEGVPIFLHKLLEKNLVFESDFPMIKINFEKVNKKRTKE